MKIAHKITAIVLFLLFALALNATIALIQLSKVSDELKDMASQDVLLREVTASVTAHQLERAILFERTLHIAEELAYANPSETRKKYLDDQLLVLKKGFEKSAESGALNIIKGKDFLEAKAQEALKESTKNDLHQASQIMRKIEQAHISYDALFINIFQAIKAGHFALSIEDLNTIELKEKSLRSQLSKLKN